jgi:hypothetical protein
MSAGGISGIGVGDRWRVGTERVLSFGVQKEVSSDICRGMYKRRGEDAQRPR